jgi:hypothetical protein
MTTALPIVKIDDGDAVGFSTTGAWDTAADQGFMSDVRFSAAGTGNDKATWDFTGLTNGSTYQVWPTWSPHANRASNAPYTISHGATPQTVRVNQELAPDALTDMATGWEYLAAYTLSGTTMTVELSDDANE